MLRFFIRRVLFALLALFAVSVTAFVLFFAVPADPAATMCRTKICPVDQAARIRTSLGLDRPIVVQYSEYMRGIFTGRQIGSGSDKIACPAPCLGVSFRNRLPVLTIIKQGLPVTLSVVLGGAITYLTVGLVLGTTAALRRGSTVDRFSIGFSLTAYRHGHRAPGRDVRRRLERGRRHVVRGHRPARAAQLRKGRGPEGSIRHRGRRRPRGGRGVVQGHPSWAARARALPTNTRTPA